ncbi:hypothetical protein N7G274_005668 [Stereocaulon virgatum]|uniref:Uncharacterized protein n=1 Tax=Stereocaulon virgatum TaxID=373712 RepID=A0ABR4A8Q7_9LECA
MRQANEPILNKDTPHHSYFAAYHLSDALTSNTSLDFRTHHSSPEDRLVQIPPHGAPTHTTPVTSASSQTRISVAMDSETPCSGTTVVPDRSPPRKNFALPRSPQRRNTKKKPSRKRSPKGLPSKQGSKNHAPPKQNASMQPSSTKRRNPGPGLKRLERIIDEIDRRCKERDKETKAGPHFTPMNAPTNITNSGNFEDTPMDEAPPLCHTKTLQDCNAVDDVESDDDSPAATAIQRRCAREAAPSPTNHIVLPCQPCNPSSSFRPINEVRHSAYLGDSEDTKMKDTPSIARTKTLEIPPPRRSMFSGRKNWMWADWFPFKVELSAGAENTPQMRAWEALDCRQRAVAELGLKHPAAPQTPALHKLPDDRNILNGSNDRRFSVVSTLKRSSKETDDITSSRKSTDDISPSNNSPEKPTLPSFELGSYRDLENRRWNIFQSTCQVQSDCNSQNPNGSTNSNASTDETTPPTTSPEEATFPPYELESYRELVETREENLHTIRQAPSKPTLRQNLYRRVAMSAPRLPLTDLTEQRTGGTITEGSSDTMRMTHHASKLNNPIAGPRHPLHEGSLHNDVVPDQGDCVASNYEAPENSNVPMLSFKRATMPNQMHLPYQGEILPRQQNLLPLSEALNTTGLHHTRNRGYRFARPDVDEKWYEPVTLPLPQTPNNPTNADFPDHNLWRNQREGNTRGVLPDIGETRRWIRLPDGGSALAFGANPPGPPMKPFDNRKAEDVAQEQWQAMVRAREAQKSNEAMRWNASNGL